MVMPSETNAWKKIEGKCNSTTLPGIVYFFCSLLVTGALLRVFLSYLTSMYLFPTTTKSSSSLTVSKHSTTALNRIRFNRLQLIQFCQTVGSTRVVVQLGWMHLDAAAFIYLLLAASKWLIQMYTSPFFSFKIVVRPQSCCPERNSITALFSLSPLLRVVCVCVWCSRRNAPVSELSFLWVHLSTFSFRKLLCWLF